MIYRKTLDYVFIKPNDNLAAKAFEEALAEFPELEPHITKSEGLSYIKYSYYEEIPFPISDVSAMGNLPIFSDHTTLVEDLDPVISDEDVTDLNFERANGGFNV